MDLFLQRVEPKLYMLLLGCKPKGRFTEQHDVFFGIGHSLRELVPHIYNFWPEAKGNLHIDAWREISRVDGYTVRVISKKKLAKSDFGFSTKQGDQINATCEISDQGAQNQLQLFFLNLGGYKIGEFEEFHYKFLSVAENPTAAIKSAKAASFYKHTGFKGAGSHVDEKYGVDVDDILAIQDILNPLFKDQYALEILPGKGPEDELHLGYLQLWRIKETS